VSTPAAEALAYKENTWAPAPDFPKIPGCLRSMLATARLKSAPNGDEAKTLAKPDTGLECVV
jgi:hypothetical protein